MISIDERYCKGCFLCVSYCPKKVIAKSAKTNSKGYTLPYAANPDECSKCKTCELMCPDLAITVEGESN